MSIELTPANVAYYLEHLLSNRNDELWPHSMADAPFTAAFNAWAEDGTVALGVSALDEDTGEYGEYQFTLTVAPVSDDQHTGEGD